MHILIYTETMWGPVTCQSYYDEEVGKKHATENHIDTHFCEITGVSPLVEALWQLIFRIIES